MLPKSSAARFVRRIAHLLGSGVRSFAGLLARALLRLLNRPLHSNRGRRARAGFALPTATMVLLVISLLIGAMVTRSSERANEVIVQRQLAKVSNAASPAIERAKAKLEFLFERDPRIPAAIPAEELLKSLVANDGIEAAALPTDPYTLPGEKRLNLDGNPATIENAWLIQEDIDNNKTIDSGEGVRYSINMLYGVDTNDDGVNDVDLSSSNLDKAEYNVVRSGPIAVGDATGRCASGGRGLDGGWFEVSGARLRKNFQVDAVANRPNSVTPVLATLEFQQDRQLDRGNAYGAWFRADLEVTPGSDFRWNGTMHTEGSVFIGQTDGGNFLNDTRLYLISSDESCFYDPGASQITMAQNLDPNGDTIFQGQAISGRLRFNDFNQVDTFIDIHPKDDTGPSGDTLQQPFIGATDLVLADNNETPFNYTLDPIVLFTQDVSQSRNPGDPENDGNRDNTQFMGNKLYNDLENPRILNTNIPRPYVDDTYRADDRWGPEPVYNRDISTSVADYGQTITVANAGSTETFDELTRDANPILPESAGLDGYWERRASAQGLRTIVGQRLELGNPFGWRSNDEPLYPPTDIFPDPGVTGASTVAASDNRNEQIQRRTLRDNLAAVQSTAIYHYLEDAEFPVACMSTTVHPGTFKTFTNSIDFNQLTYRDSTGTNISSRSNFFFGKGTNGWEYAPPAKGTFASDVANATSELGKALRNLAYFAGDPDGAFPPLQEVSAGASLYPVTHPYPYLSMWGDFSGLRRALSLLDSGTPYIDLSLADKTTLQTASCTLGILARNLVELDNFDYQESATSAAALIVNNPVNPLEDERLFGALALLTDGIGEGNGEVVLEGDFGPKDPTNPQEILIDGTTTLRKIDLREEDSSAPLPGDDTDDNDIRMFIDNGSPAGEVQYVSVNTEDRPYTTPYEAYNTAINFIEPSSFKGTVDDLRLARRFLRFLHTREQVRRDREHGFENGLPSDGFCSEGGPSGTGFGTGVGDIDANKADLLRMAVCSDIPKFPALHFLFPVFSDTTTSNFEYTGSPVGAKVADDDDEPYLNRSTPDGETNIPAGSCNGRNPADYICRVNVGIRFNRVNPSDVALNPRANATAASWSTPLDPGNSTGPNVIFTGYDGGAPDSPVSIAFQDKAFFDGRQMMEVRTLDYDLELLRNNTVGGGDFWLPTSGVVYAFREDAVREDAISRPRRAAWSDCNTEVKLTGFDPLSRSVQGANAQCRMLVTGNQPTDPPVLDSGTASASYGISPKPVDFFMDPERRAHGFRLRRGADLRRGGADVASSLSFITDNSLYIQGDFNLHTDGSNRLEEFKGNGLLKDNYSNFYLRTANDLDDKFADPEGDRWRVAELLADSITILTETFCDGAVEGGLRSVLGLSSSPYEICTNSESSSYASGRWEGDPQTTGSFTGSLERWYRENPFDVDQGGFQSNFDFRRKATYSSPIFVDRDGRFYYIESSTSTYQDPGDAGSANNPLDGWSEYYGDVNDYLNGTGGLGDVARVKIQRPASGTDMTVNAILVSGITPSRSGQTDGGFVNFPRMLQDWDTNRAILRINGAFIQLNYSTSGTGPFDQELLESDWVGGNPGNLEFDEFNGYYTPPIRRWGYDIGLQYLPPGPVSERFVTVGSPRTETYREIRADDPYIDRLLKGVPN
ncbi:hypothetical protein KR51_00021800 [Rubidibacter lacunae KORDI 51-2]|uniref:Uncharacterized protein n=1 Tax=Rubidibacter lacunae KORDI 51-2 TaxID=582515 RepID=U5DNK8_9CHRO|nr:hormogonium polysaccharide biosynthesis protein HpsA [Rubidibacter lacunae]ERN41290.1 hypothetical protein KR51_00021800 [Rubidibacter lacunae KORDI 51-2]